MNSLAFEPSFNILMPIRTVVGWPARVIGILQRRSNPYVVALWNPTWKSEELHTYPASGKHQGSVEANPLDLVNIPDAEYFAWAAPGEGKTETPVHAFVVKEPDWPRNQNVARLDSMSLITPMHRGWSMLSEGFDRATSPRPLPNMKFYNERTGNVFTLRFSPMDKQELEALDAK